MRLYRLWPLPVPPTSVPNSLFLTHSRHLAFCVPKKPPSLLPLGLGTRCSFRLLIPFRSLPRADASLSPVPSEILQTEPPSPPARYRLLPVRLLPFLPPLLLTAARESSNVTSHQGLPGHPVVRGMAAGGTPWAASRAPHLTPRAGLWQNASLLPRFPNEETEARRGVIICLRPHGRSSPKAVLLSQETSPTLASPRPWPLRRPWLPSRHPSASCLLTSTV